MADDRARTDVERLVAEHHQAVYAYAFRLCGSAPDAEDLTQQTFLSAQQKLGQLRNLERTRGWLFAILRNRFLKTCQRQQPVPASVVGLNLDGLPAEADADDGIDRQQLQEALKELPADFRVILVMFYFEDRSYREIAEELSLPIGTVMSRLARGKQHLRRKLLPQEPVLHRKPQPTTW
jgi:RNA polymerase sigma-70 factor, ECF subfamily